MVISRNWMALRAKLLKMIATPNNNRREVALVELTNFFYWLYHDIYMYDDVKRLVVDASANYTLPQLNKYMKRLPYFRLRKALVAFHMNNMGGAISSVQRWQIEHMYDRNILASKNMVQLREMWMNALHSGFRPLSNPSAEMIEFDGWYRNVVSIGVKDIPICSMSKMTIV